MKVLHVFTLPVTAESFFDGQFRYLSELGHNITIAANSPLNSDFCTRNKVRSKIIPIKRSISPFSDIKSIAILWSYIKQNDFDIVVGHTPKGAMIAMIAAWLAGVQTRIYYRHGVIYTTAHGIKRFILKTVERVTSAFASQIVNVSSSLSNLAVNDHLNSNKKQVVIGSGTCDGIDTINLFNPELVSDKEKSDIRASLNISISELVIGYCGRICKEKGIRELIDGFNLFRQEHPDTKLLLVGYFDNRDILPPEYKKEIEDNPNILLVGQVDKSKLPLYYSIINVLVLPSYREGFGMCVIEASAMKCPVLVSRSHGCIDSIQDQITGEYIDISMEGVSKGLESMCDDTKRMTYGENGREWVVDNFDHRIMWPYIKQFYNDVIKTTMSK